MKTKALISFAVTAKLICVFVFAYAKKRFSHNEAQLIQLLYYLQNQQLRHNKTCLYAVSNQLRHKPGSLQYSHSLIYLSRDVRKPAFCIWENKEADQLRGYREADQRLCFRYIDSTCNPSTSYIRNFKPLVWLYSPVCVGPGRKPRRPVFS